MITAQFGNKKFEVTAKKIHTVDDTAISESIETEEKAIKGKKPSVTVKGIKLQTLSYKVKLDARFVDVVAELRWWKNTLLAKKSAMFILGTYKVGQFYLSQYDIADVVMNKKGDYLSATITLTFTEDGNFANKKKTNFDSTKKAAAVKKSKDTKNNKNIKKGTKVKPKSGTRWYYTAEGALKKTGKSGKAYNKVMTVTYVYQNGKAINPQGLGWMRPEDVDIV